jgi:hypothetical protein
MSDDAYLSDAPARTAADLETRRSAVLALLRDEIWPRLAPAGTSEPITREERDAMLGYGPDGV